MDAFLPEELLFEVPVYRLSPDEFHQDLVNLTNRHLRDAERRAHSFPWSPKRPEPKKHREERIRNWVRRMYGRPYWYNEMIGVVRLYQDGGSIKGEMWGQPHRSFRRNFRHYAYGHHGRVLEWHCPPAPLTSADVYSELLEHLSSLTQRGAPLQGRYVDLYAFRRVGPQVDWLSVLGWKGK